MNQEKLKALQSLKTAKGQIDGIIKMIENDRYCIDISNQILASQSLLKKAQMLILQQHLEHCVNEACSDGQVGEKLEEIMLLFERIMK